MENIELFKKYPLVSVVMTTYNVEKYVEKAILSILNQTYKKLELIIIDDNSNDKTVSIIESLNDPRIKLFQNTENAGTFFCKNYGILQSKGDFIAIQDSDDYSSALRIEKQLKYFDKFPDTVIVKCQYVRVTPKGKILTEPKAAFQASLIRRSVFDEMGFYDTVRAAGDDEFDFRAKKFYGSKRVAILPELLYYNLHRSDSLTNTIVIGGSERVDYVKNYRKWHESVNSKEELQMPYPHVERKFDIPTKLLVKNAVYNKNRFKRIKIKAELITATVVSIKRREVEFEKVVQDILPQVDLLKVYLNDYPTTPKFLKNKKIKVFHGDKFAGDIGDNGKFYSIEKLQGFHFTIDDDIHYPKDYVKVLMENLENFSYRAVVGVHGIDIIYESFKHYYDLNSRVVYSFPHALAKEKQVHLLGTGTVAYHTSTVKFDFTEINHRFMVDIFFGMQMCRKNIPMIAIRRKKSWMQEYEVVEDSKIYNQLRKDDKIQTKLILENHLSKPRIEVCDTLDEAAGENMELEKKLQHKLEKYQIKLNQMQNQVKVMQEEIFSLNQQKDWYSRTYDHLPLTYLKLGSIFRRLKIKKKF